MKSFKRGIVLYGSYPGVVSDEAELLHRLRAIALDQVFDVVELPLTEERSVWPEIRKIADTAGIQAIVSAGPSIVRKGWNLSSTDDGVRREAVDGMYLAVDYCLSIGAKALVFMSGRDPGPGGRSDAEASLRRSLAALAEYSASRCAGRGLSFLLEPADRDVTHRQLLGPSREVVSFVTSARKVCPNLGVALDLSHIPQLGESLEETTRVLGSLVSHAHLANCVVSDPGHPRYGDAHPSFGIPHGEYSTASAVRFARLLFEDCFPDVSFFPYGKPVMSLEVKPGEGEDPDLVLAGAKRVLGAMPDCM